MTAAEHSLMIAMFARQAMLIKTLVNIIESHGVPISPDLVPFDLAIQYQERMDFDIFQKTVALYQRVGKKLDLEIPVQFPAQ